MAGQNIVPSVIGPIGHCLSDLELMTRTILSAEAWSQDPQVLPLRWREEDQENIRMRAKTSKLCFGVMKWDGMVMPHPPILRAINQAVEKLRSCGHQV